MYNPSLNINLKYLSASCLKQDVARLLNWSIICVPNGIERVVLLSTFLSAKYKKVEEIC